MIDYLMKDTRTSQRCTGIGIWKRLTVRHLKVKTCARLMLTDVKPLLLSCCVVSCGLERTETDTFKKNMGKNKKNATLVTL